MAVPASGALSLRGIRNEFHNNNYNGTTIFTNISLEQASIGNYGVINTQNSVANRPDTVSPHAMSEFYSYDHDKAPAGTTPTVSTSNATWSCKGMGAINMVGSVNTSPSGHSTTEYGFVYSPNNSNPTIGGFGVQKDIVGTSNYNGFFSNSQNNVLAPCCCGTTNYYVRAYAINSIGTAYGNTLTVTITDCSCGSGDDPDGPGGPGDFPF